MRHIISVKAWLDGSMYYQAKILGRQLYLNDRQEPTEIPLVGLPDNLIFSAIWTLFKLTDMVKGTPLM